MAMYNNPWTPPVTASPQQRLAMMESQFPQFAPQMPANGIYGQQGYNTMPQQQTMLKGRPVANEEEANAAMIDFDGSLFVFPDKAHGKIYTKQLGLDGNIIFHKYSIDQPEAVSPVPQQQPATQEPIDLSGYVLKEDVEKTFSEMQDKLSRLEQRLANMNTRGGNK